VGRKKDRTADDNLFLVELDSHKILALKCIVRCFKVVSRLRINLLKSTLGRLGMENNIENRYVEMMNCKIMSLPFTYLY